VPATFLVDTGVDLPDANPGDGVALTPAGTVSLRSVFDEILANPAVVGNANDLPNAGQYGPAVYQIEFANVHNQQFQNGSGGIEIPTANTEMGILLGSQLPTIPANLTFAINGSTTRRVTITRQPEPVAAEPGEQPPMTPYSFLKVGANGRLLTYGLKFVGAYNNVASGGAILNEGTLEVGNSEFRSNTANEGGAIYNEGDLIVSGGWGVIGELPGVKSLFVDNLAPEGGAISSKAAGHAAVISDTQFVTNTAGLTLQEGTGFGGGISHTDGTMSITGCSFDGNRGSGGAVYSNVIGALINPSLVISNTTFGGNVADSGYGGALYLNNNTVSCAGCSFSFNSADKEGGAIMMDRADLTLATCSFAGNMAWGTFGILDVAQLGPPGPGMGAIHADEASEGFYHGWVTFE
jgi:Chlamydia polymorphic membrane protein (Chlamydia_PMP) repeat